ncbi:MAG: pyrroline-5-carboxylate reductase [Pseudomonadota bacterium]|nr:pyrroline-5-carboxylate reductase [Pseudomonadota bacterium]
MTDSPAWPGHVLMVGCGNMGGAMLAGWLTAGFAPARFTIVDPGLAQAPAGVRLLREMPAPDRFDAVLLGIKPQLLDQVAPALAALAGPDTVVLSILAGVQLASLSARLPNAGAIVRVMPNLAAAIGKSPVVLVGTEGVARDAITALMAPLGAPEWIADEGLFDAVTALVGSGPAFVYRFIAALADGGAALGLPREQAERMALAMVEGAGALAGQSPMSPEELARRVTSPGGTTAAGLKVLDDNAALARLVTATLRAARDRGAEMAAAARG